MISIHVLTAQATHVMAAPSACMSTAMSAGVAAGAGVHVGDGAFLGANESIGVTLFLQFCTHPLLPSGTQQGF